MKKSIFLYVFIFFFYSISFCGENSNYKIYFKIDFDSKKSILPLKILKHKPIRPPLDPEGKFIVEDGIFFSQDGNFVEGVVQFNDESGGNWEVKFSSERLANKNYSVISVITIYNGFVQQQNDFSFKGMPVDILNYEVSPFKIIGLKTKKNQWFSLSFLVEKI